jgi:hypothetical protein
MGTILQVTKIWWRSATLCRCLRNPSFDAAAESHPNVAKGATFRMGHPGALYPSKSFSAFATCAPVNGLGTNNTLCAFRERRLASATSGVSLIITTGSSA